MPRLLSTTILFDELCTVIIIKISSFSCRPAINSHTVFMLPSTLSYIFSHRLRDRKPLLEPSQLLDRALSPGRPLLTAY